MIPRRYEVGEGEVRYEPDAARCVRALVLILEQGRAARAAQSAPTVTYDELARLPLRSQLPSGTPD